MLKQNINFYQMEIEYSPLLSATLLVQIWLFLFAGLAVMAFFQKWSLNSQSKNIQNIKTMQLSVNEQLQLLGKELKAKTNPQGLQQKLIVLKEKIEKTQNAINQLQVQENKKNYPLSSYLEGFAKTHIKGMYVSHFYMQNDGMKMSFEGTALQPQLIPQMVQSWEQTIPMKGRRFQKLNMQRIKKDADWVQFNLQAL
jgi:hypothetical protein